MKKKKILPTCIMYLIAASLLIAFDQWTKRLASAHLKDGSVIPIIPGVLEFRYLENRGAAFGMLQNQKILFIVMGCAILIIIAFAFYKTFASRRFVALRVLLAFIATGALGNMIDRISLDYVVDFIYFSLINFPIFNIADCYVTVATAVFIILWLFYYKEKELDYFFSLRMHMDEEPEHEQP